MAIEFCGRVVPVEDELKMVLDGGCQKRWGACNGKGEGGRRDKNEGERG